MKLTALKIPFCCLLFVFVPAVFSQASAEELRFYIGTYTGGASKGIYMATMDPDSGKVSKPVLVAETQNPSFLAIHPNNKYLYAVGELTEYQGKPSGTIEAYAIDRSSGKLELLNKRPSDGGAPCHLVVDTQGKFVLFANYVGGNVGVMPIGKDGKLGTRSGFIQHKGSSVSPRQKGPHAHAINLDAKNRFAVAADLGLDKLITYHLSKKGKLKKAAEHSEKPGSGPRHFVFHPDGKHGYLLNEMNSTVSALSYDSETGKFTSVQTLSTIPKDWKGRKSCAEIRIHPSGKFLYCSNRGHDSIAVFQLSKDGTMARTEIVKTGGQEPRNFNLCPNGRFLLAENQKSDSIVVFAVNQLTGKLTRTGYSVKAPTPVCIRFLHQK